MTNPIVCGVYCLFLRQGLVYIGKSKDCYARVNEHRSKGRAFDYSVVTPCVASDVAWVERAMIQAMAPRQNVVHATGIRPGAMAQQVLAQVAKATAKNDGPPKHGREPWSIQESRRYVASLFLPRAPFEAALRDGDIPLHFRSPKRTSPGSPRFVYFDDLDRWVKRLVDERDGINAEVRAA